MLRFVRKSTITTSAFILTLVALSAFGPPVSFAAPSGPPAPSSIPLPINWIGTIGGGGVINPGGGLGVLSGGVVPLIISALMFILFAAAIIFGIIGGIMYMTGMGNKEGTAKAKAAITYAFLGLILGLLSFIILNALGFFFDSNLLGN